MKKQYKILFLIVICSLIFGIYQLFPKNKINYIALGDSVAEGRNPYGEIGFGYTDYLKEKLEKEKKLKYYTKKYSHSGYETSDVINDIIRNSDIKRDLRESDLVTISIGANDFLSSIDLANINIDSIKNYQTNVMKIFKEVDQCIKEVRKYAKNKLYIIGYYNPIPFLFNQAEAEVDQLFTYIDSEYQKIAEKYDAIYISNYDLFKKHPEYLPNPMDIHPDTKGYQAMAEIIYQRLKQEKLKNY